MIPYHIFLFVMHVTCCKDGTPCNSHLVIAVAVEAMFRILYAEGSDHCTNHAVTYALFRRNFVYVHQTSYFGCVVNLLLVGWKSFVFAQCVRLTGLKSLDVASVKICVCCQLVGLLFCILTVFLIETNTLFSVALSVEQSIACSWWNVKQQRILSSTRTIASFILA